MCLQFFQLMICFQLLHKGANGIAFRSGDDKMVFGKSTLIGLVICLFAGVCFSLFSPAFNLATNDQWHTLEDGVPHISVYTAFSYFSCSCFVIAVILNITFLSRPAFNLPRSSIKAYLNDWDGRGWAFLAGFLCGFGNGLQFMGGQAAGYTASDAVQALPLVSTFWGVLFFGECRKSSKRTYVLLVGMLSMFIYLFDHRSYDYVFLLNIRQVYDSSTFAFWSKSTIDNQPRRIMLQSNSYTTNTLLTQ